MPPSIAIREAIVPRLPPRRSVPAGKDEERTPARPTEDHALGSERTRGCGAQQETSLASTSQGGGINEQIPNKDSFAMASERSSQTAFGRWLEEDDLLPVGKMQVSRRCIEDRIAAGHHLEGSAGGGRHGRLGSVQFDGRPTGHLAARQYRGPQPEERITERRGTDESREVHGHA